MADNALEKTKELMLMLKRVYHEIPMAEGPKKEIAICFSNLKKNHEKPHARNDPQRLEQLEDAGITQATPDQLRGLLAPLTA
jgi:hypothetical protein